MGTMLRRCLLIPLALFSLSAQADDYATAASMHAAGADELALSFMLKHPRTDAKWMGLEFDLLEKSGKHENALKIAQTLPFSKETSLAAARSALVLDKPGIAGNFLARAIWQGSLAKPELRRARLDAVRVLLMEKDWRNAYYAMLRFDQDYHPVTKLEAEIFSGGLLDAGMAKESLPWLSTLDEQDPVRVKVELSTGLIDAAEAMKRAGDDPAILRIAAQTAQDPSLRIRAQEALVASGKFDGRALWQSYLDHATGYSNRYALLQGNYGAWNAAIARIPDPYAARSLLAYLSTQTKDDQPLASLIDTLKDEPKVAIALFSGRADLPQAEKQTLGEMAYESGDYASCIKYWAGLAQPNALKLAYAYAKTGQYAQASSQMNAYFKGKTRLDAPSSSLALSALMQYSPPPKPELEALLAIADAGSKNAVLMTLGRLSSDPEAAAVYYFLASSGRKNDPASILCLESLKAAGFDTDASTLATRWK